VHAEDPQRAGDVLQTLLPEILERQIELVADLVAHDPTDADATGLGKRLQARHNVDPVAVDIVFLDDHIVQVDADPELDAPSAGNFPQLTEGQATEIVA
jgi:hypothetical protein